MKQEQKTVIKNSCLTNGKLTGLVIILVLIFFMILALTALSLLVVKHDKVDNTFKDPMWKLFFGSSFYVGANGITAMVKRGGDFIKVLLPTKKNVIQ